MRTVLLLALLISGVLTACRPEGPPSRGLSISLNGIEDALDDLLVVPPSGFAVQVDFSGVSAPVLPGSLTAVDLHWGDAQPVDLTPDFAPDADGLGATALVSGPLEPGSHTIAVLVQLETLEWAQVEFDYAVRTFASGSGPIGQGQQIWYDFDVDRDANGQPDFPVDLRYIGLGSTADPVLSDQVRQRVQDALMAQVESVYFDSNPLGLAGGDPVEITFSAVDPGSGDVTRICVGGRHPNQSAVIGSILIDPQNANRNSVECGTTPPAGVFPRGIQAFTGDPGFDAVFAPVRKSMGGIPIGEHPLDPIVLDPGFTLVGATAEEFQRYLVVELAIDRYVRALGTVMAHETGHALGLVAPGTPGTGLFGGSVGNDFSHAVDETGAPPAGAWLMKAGDTFDFDGLAGLGPDGLPRLRAIDHAYLRDRLVIDPSVTALWPPPKPASVSPGVVANTLETLVVLGGDFVSVPRLRLVSTSWSYELIGEAFVSATQVTGLVVKSQVPPGVYDLEVVNPDGQSRRLVGAVTVAP